MVEQKIENYLKNYARRKNLILIQEKMKFFTKTHENLLEIIPTTLQKYL